MKHLCTLIFISLTCFFYHSSFCQVSVFADKKIEGYFNYVTLDSVYNTFSNRCKVRIVYDTIYCKGKRFTNLFPPTELEAAIQSTLTGGHDSDPVNLRYYIDANNTIHIVQKEIVPTSSTASYINKYTGPAKQYNFTLTGILRDRATGETLPFGSIRLKGTTQGTTSNIDGYFTLFRVPTDTSSLMISYIGYHNTEIQLNPTLPKTNLVVEIDPVSQLLDMVTITANREELLNVSNKEISILRMSPQKLTKLPNVGEKDIMRSFQLLPGVSASNESSSGMYVRGGTPDQNLVLYDGFSIYHVEHLYGFFSAFNANAVKDVQLYKGGFESRFGGRLSSVTEITGKEGNQKDFNAGGELSLLSFNAFVETPFGKKVTFLAAARKSYKSPVYKLIFNQYNKKTVATTTPSGGMGNRSVSQTEPTSYFYDLNSKVTYRPNDKDIFSFSIFNGTDNLDNGFNNERSGGPGMGFNSTNVDLTKYGNLGSSLKWSRKWNPKIYGLTLISYSNYYSRRDKSSGGNVTNNSGETTNFSKGIFEDNNLKDFSLKSDYQYDISERNQIQAGLFGTYYDIRYTYTQNDTVDVLKRMDYGSLTGLYFQDRIKCWQERIQLVPGIRLNYFNITGKFYPEPRFMVNVNLTKKLSLKAATGQYDQFANRVVREDIFSGSKDFWVLANGKTIPVGQSLHYILGLSLDRKNYLFSCEAYYKDISGLTEYSLRFQPDPKVIKYTENFYNGKGFARGIEFLVQKKTGSLSGWASYTLGEAKNYFEIYSSNYYPANQDVTHEFKIVSMYSYKRWDFSATWIYATGRPYTSPSGSYTVTLLDGTTRDFYVVSAKNSQRLPDYHRMDIAANYKLYIGEGIDRREIGYIGFSLFNLYNRKNTWYKNYQIEEGQVIETDVNYLGITPNLVISLKIR
ncbi:MAG: TonB-dependent receptor [Bacteroidetes bacterium]|nr:TonB-dependent receptor [Bacteroidota bacterium]